MIGSDSEVGHTEVDLEKRLFSQYRATVGLPCKYCISGPLPWRDNMSPLAILKNFCKRMHYPAPELFPIDENDAAITAFGVTYKLSEVAPKTHKRNGMLGRPLQRVALHILLQMGLVPEHVETRALHGPGGIDVVTGKLQMFVDLLPLRAGPIKPPVDISPRQPVRYQLRVVIWSVHGALLSKTSIGRKVADLYVKCFLEGAKKEERTDIHFRSTDGNASFNWRFVIDFDYDIWEEKVVFRSKKLFSRQKKEELYEPILKIEVCDNNRFQPDTLIGERYVDLREFPEAEIDDDGNPTVPTIPLQQSSCCARAGTCWKKTLCCIRKRHRELAKLPRPVLYEPKNHRSFSLFKERRTYGWWPFLSAPFTELKKMSYTALKKKNDDHTEKSRCVTANVKMELELLTQDEAEQLPCPYLPPPYRSSMDDHWCTSRLNAATSFCCRTYATKCFFITVTLTLLLIIAFLTIYRLPARFLKWLFGLP
ncbi:unnamed protein product [Toxocara canis]|uniref:C2 domain-containing protein n=1 Tax=Toxocara canis TaxID=6265 RepID=A0A3P7IHE7_TOXCA|nr:unnamed protein product [Toxocara canis]